MIEAEWLPSDDFLREQSYLVARGVRPMAHVSEFPAEPDLLIAVATRLESEADANSIPFVIDHGNGHASCGYAGSGWVVDLYRWTVTDAEIPQEQRARIIGLLLGYSPAAIASFEDHAAGRRYWMASPPGVVSR